MSDLPWYAWAAIVAVFVIGIPGALAAFNSTRGLNPEELAKSQADALETNKLVADRLAAIEQRLAAIEKTLTDIP